MIYTDEIRKLSNGNYALYSKTKSKKTGKKRKLFEGTEAQVKERERQINYFKAQKKS